ncbi:hypothetical protein LCGC14_3046960 [marine sediment metagenome]|uniref:Uncharacterized protein n=1 Tax=marine sediment metagenome TaxID=412755 RepID=A0A0F8WNA7_9ZZZZ
MKDEGFIGTHWRTALDTNDYIEVHLANETDISNFTLRHLLLSAIGSPI